MSSIKPRTLFFAILGVSGLVFLYIERSILTPFILAAIFAYIFNPLINFFSRVFKFPRALSIILVYIIMISSAIYLGGIVIRDVINESDNIRQTVLGYINYLRENIDTLPAFIQPYILSYADFSRLQLEKVGLAAFPVFSFAFSGIINFLVFIFATFFFLKDNEQLTHRFLLFFPDSERVEVSTLIRKINLVLSKYLRGQVILISSLAVMLFIAFSFLGVRNALTIAVASSLAGIVPMLGTIAALVIGTFVILISGGLHNFQLGILETIGVIVAVYYAAQLVQDYVLSPIILGKAVRLHPLVILFAALAGGNIGGILGLILAVPIAATLKLILEFVLDKINNKDYLARDEHH